MIACPRLSGHSNIWQKIAGKEYRADLVGKERMGKHSAGISYWQARERRKDLRNRSKSPKRTSSRRLGVIVLVFVLAFAIGGALGFYIKPIGKLGARVYLSLKEGQWQPKGEEKKQVEKELAIVSKDPAKSINTLVMGYDKGSNKGEGGWCRSDVMMVVCIQEREKRAVVISIPRDTMVQIPGHGTQKINAAHAFGGPSGAINAVKSLLGIDINHYVDTDFTGFKKIVTAVGGVPIHLDKPINDPHAGYLPAGNLLLDGEQALIVVRSRNLPNGDIDRIKSQQTFIKALITKLKGMGVMQQKQILDQVAGTVQMDYSGGELMTMAEEMKNFSLDSAQFITIPGDTKYVSGASYFVASAPGIAELVAQVNQNTQVTPELVARLSQWTSSPVNELYQPNDDVIKVMSNQKTMPSTVVISEELALVGHQTVTTGLFKQGVPKTVIYHRMEAKEASEAIKKQLPELTNAQVVENNTYTSQYNAPMVIMLQDGFQSGSLKSVYGRLMQPAVDTESLGEHFKNFI